MIGLIATLRVKDGEAEAFEDIFRELMGKVKAAEAGTLVYQLTKSRTEANTYKVVELYQDQAALDVHAKTDELRGLLRSLGPHMVGRAEIEYLDAVV